MKTGRPTTGGSELPLKTIIACADELKALAEALAIFESSMCDMTQVDEISSIRIETLQDLDRIQQTMVALSNVLNSIGMQDRLDYVVSNVPLASLRLRLQNRVAINPSNSGDLSLF